MLILKSQSGFAYSPPCCVRQHFPGPTAFRMGLERGFESCLSQPSSGNHSAIQSVRENLQISEPLHHEKVTFVYEEQHLQIETLQFDTFLGHCPFHLPISPVLGMWSLVIPHPSSRTGREPWCPSPAFTFKESCKDWK